jgi:hypothetical protein
LCDPSGRHGSLIGACKSVTEWTKEGRGVAWTRLHGHQKGLGTQYVCGSNSAQQYIPRITAQQSNALASSSTLRQGGSGDNTAERMGDLAKEQLGHARSRSAPIDDRAFVIRTTLLSLTGSMALIVVLSGTGQSLGRAQTFGAEPIDRQLRL